MPTISTTTLPNGSRVEVSTGDAPRNGTYDLVAKLFDAKGVAVRTITVDTASNSDGSTAPPRSESFANVSVVGLSNGGFAVAYDDTVVNPPGGSNVAEIRLYDATGVASGSKAIGTSTGGEPFPPQGAPQLAAAADGGVVAVVGVSGGMSVVQVLSAAGATEGSKTYEGRPAAVYDAGLTGQVVVTLTQGRFGEPLANPVQEVLTHSMTLVSSTPLVDTRGTDAGEVLTGGANADRLFGLAGDDTLQGGASFDTLTGGAGRDKFVFKVDGSVDQAADFDAAQDSLALVDASGAPLNSATGVLTFWRGSGALTYDPDGDLGPAAAQTVAVLPGVKTLTEANLAPGFEPGVLRIYNPITPAQAGQSPGTRSDLTFGYGKENYVSASADYSVTGVLLTYGVNFKDGTSSMRWFDTTDAQTWDGLVADYDAQGRLAIYATYDDDGSHVLWRYDANSSQNWQRIVEHFDAQGRITSRDVVYDDNSRYEAIYDVAGTQPWGYAVDTYNAAGVRTARTLYNDDGSVIS